MADIARVSELLVFLEGIDAAREQIESLVRDEITSLLVEPLKALIGELDANDGSLDEDDLQLLASIKQRLATAIPTDQAIDDASNAAGEVVLSSVAKAEEQLLVLRAWLATRESADPLVVDDQAP
jgi:hypothetical protein